MTFGVTTGAQTELQLRSAEPTHIVDSLGEMCDLVIAATK
jgi:phosphoglycolate phosphatase-like HAD superfamily hydrolase